MRIVAVDDLELSEEHYRRIRALGDVTLYYDMPTEETAAASAKTAQIITTGWLPITRKIIDSAKDLQFIVVEAAGYQQYVDTEYATKKGIKILNCPTFSAKAVSNMTIGFILSLTRKIKAADRSIQQGKWLKVKHEGIELEGRTLGLIGYGNIGKIVGDLAERLGMNVLYSNSRTSRKEIERIISRSDIVSLHLPLNEKTRHMFNGRMFALMKKGAYFINVSRGGIIDQKALIKALKSKHLAGAALDVFEDEPNKEMNRGIPKGIVNLADMDNVIATPHIAYRTEETRKRLGDEMVRNIESCVKGKPINVVN